MLHKTLSEFRTYRKSIPADKSVGFVPTMGALHEGHATLLRKARAENDIVVLSVFVNPLQFGPNEDLAKYPRTLEADLAMAKKEGVDAVFVPTPEMMYPAHFATQVSVTKTSEPLCGQFRPGHFDGVATVVLKLFNIVQPTSAYFGLKDAQQFILIKRMSEDLNLSLDIVGVPTVRESNGLALSSRNRYLSNEERELAPLIYKTLIDTRERLARTTIKDALASGRQSLTDAGFKVQYLELRTLPLLAPFEENAYKGEPALLAVAAYLGSTRLIDNLFLNNET